MSIAAHKELTDCLDEFELDPLKQVQNLSILRMRALKIGEMDEEGHKLVGGLIQSNLALMRLGIEDKQADSDSEIALALAQQMQLYTAPKDRSVGTGSQPQLEDASIIDAIIVTDENKLEFDTVDIDKLEIF